MHKNFVGRYKQSTCFSVSDVCESIKVAKNRVPADSEAEENHFTIKCCISVRVASMSEEIQQF